jgi:hypothetical protein
LCTETGQEVHGEEGAEATLIDELARYGGGCGGGGAGYIAAKGEFPRKASNVQNAPRRRLCCSLRALGGGGDDAQGQPVAGRGSNDVSTGADVRVAALDAIPRQFLAPEGRQRATSG